MDDKNLDTVQQYVGDMLALEAHIEEALDGQLNEVRDDQHAGGLVQGFHDMVKAQREGLRAHLAAIGGSEPGPVKELVANLFGKAAGVIDNIRTKGVSKALRDDYTAFNHAAAGYAMLHGTALMLGRTDTADLAERHLRAYARAIKQIEPAIMRVVAAELRDEGLMVNDQAVGHATETLRRVWQEAASGAASGITGASDGMPRAA
jgi:ferritin-like metal-binding protein YciE